ncbi:MAG: ATP-binding cassette domain-containing protein [Elusimicrobiota bacterium]
MILEGRKIIKDYVSEGFLGTGKTALRALNGVDFKVKKNDILGIVGESGSGKTTLAKIICGLEEMTSGELVWGLSDAVKKQNPAQMVFQNPYNSLNPKLAVGYMLREAISAGRDTGFREVKDREVIELLAKVGMEDIEILNYPHQFSGGQRQRLGIARALALKPQVLVCDEPVSALDISIQAQIVNLLTRINREYGLTIIFIAHDIEVIGVISQNILVMKNGEVMEYADKETLLDSPENPYTKTLLEAVPRNPWF